MEPTIESLRLVKLAPEINKYYYLLPYLMSNDFSSLEEFSFADFPFLEKKNRPIPRKGTRNKKIIAYAKKLDAWLYNYYINKVVDLGV